jgi:16S rRNA (uracil1498-N3)-methyltransferase
MAERFYVNCPLGPGPVTLAGPEAHHMAVVCRVRPGDQVYLFNGNGAQYPAEVVAVARRSVNLTIQAVERPSLELPFKLEVAVPLPKGDRASFLVEKLTEIGVTTLVPLRTARSIVHPSENRLDKLQRTVIEASKQCGRNYLLQVKPLAEWSEYCRRAELPPIKGLAHPRRSREIRQEAVFDKVGANAIALAIGPEGGFSEEEVELAVGVGWTRIDLGPRILRVETAALVLAALASRA